MLWELIAANKRRSFILLFTMALCLLGLGYLVGFVWAGEEGAWVGLIFAGGLWTFLTLISFTAGDSILLSAAGATQIDKEIHPRLFNVVEEMKIASNLPVMPKIYIINDLGMNAFATGLNPKRSSVAVTAGLLAELNRDELEGVMAHEMSHIANRDILYMTVAGMMLGSIQLIAHFFLRNVFYVGSSRSRVRSSGRVSGGSGGGGAYVVIALIAIAFAVLGPILVQLFYFSLSRKREYLADACGVRLTRYPEGLASALEKISRHSSPMDTANQVTAPMYISHPFGEKAASLSSLWSTHPPIDKRIQILRTMQHGVSFATYQKAYEAVTAAKEVILPRSGILDTAEIPVRGSSVPEGAARVSPSREVLDLMRAVNRFSFLICTCGLKMKVPPDFKDPSLICPSCGRRYHFPK